jgi:hypothetical protein
MLEQVMNDLEAARYALTIERDFVKIHIERAEGRTEIIEEPVKRWLSDVENLLGEVEVLVQSNETDSNCFSRWCGRQNLLCIQMIKKTEAMRKFIGKGKNIQPFSHLAPLPGIRYWAVKNFNFNFSSSTEKAYNELLEALNDDSIRMIGLYGERGCGKTTLVTEVGKKVEDWEMFDKVILISVSQTPDIRDIQGQVADMLNLKLKEKTVEGRAERLWMSLKERNKILVIIVCLWGMLNLREIGIWGARKIIVITSDQHVCTLMNCQKEIHLGTF